MFKEWGTCVVDKVATLRCIPVIFKNVVSGFLIFAGAVALILIIYSGIKLVTSGGDPKQVQAARQIMTYAIIGVITVLTSFAIIYFISFVTGAERITNIDCLQTPGGCN